MSSGYNFVTLNNKIAGQLNVLKSQITDFCLVKGMMWVTVIPPRQALLMHFACSAFTIASRGTAKQNHAQICAKTVQWEIKNYPDEVTSIL